MKYIYLTIAIVSSIVLYKFDWYISGNEAIAATSQVTTGEEYGFIKFGSRIDLYLPLDSVINVKIGDIVKGRITKIGELK